MTVNRSKLRRLVYSFAIIHKSGFSNWFMARCAIKRHKAIQKVSEFAEFIKFLRGRKLETILEIGTAQGGNFWMLCNVASPTCTLISLDLPPDARISGGTKVAINLAPHCRHSQLIHQILGDSHQSEVCEKVESILAGRKLDLLFIDGDHTYDGVRKDYEMYAPLVAEGGLIAFHDIVHTEWANCNVDRFWRELTINKDCQRIEMIDPSGPAMGGIGVLLKGMPPNPGSVEGS
jgi:predicted O-methyltransferase YrrM